LAAVNARALTGRRNGALLLTMADAGLRVSEAPALQTTDPITEGGQYTLVNIRRGRGAEPGEVAPAMRAAAKSGAWQAGIGTYAHLVQEHVDRGIRSLGPGQPSPSLGAAAVIDPAMVCPAGGAAARTPRTPRCPMPDPRRPLAPQD